MKKTTQGGIEMAVAMAVSGTIGWLVVSSGQSIADLLFWRCLFGAATLLAACALLGLLRPLPWRVLAIAAAGGVAIVGNWVLLFASYRHASISVATVIYNTQPFMLVALGALLLRERVTPAALGWLGLAFGGLLLIAQAKPGTAPPGSHYGWGVALALGAALLYALAALAAKKLRQVPPHLIALVQMGVGCVLLLPWALQSGLPSGAAAWGSFAAIGVVYTGGVYILLYGALQKLPTALAGALSFIYPLVAVAVDHFAFGVRLGPAQWLGAAAILLAVVGQNWSGAARLAAAPHRS
jgi:drug/metabolite transporter (DMT)-like permease